MNSPDHQLLVAQEQCARLKQLLEEEFEALRGRNLDVFEKLQPVKAALLSALAAAAESHQTRLSQTTVESNELLAWDQFRLAMLECRDLHRRNEILILRKRDAIEGALQALLGNREPTASVDVYDRLGRVNRSGRRNAFIQA